MESSRRRRRRHASIEHLEQRMVMTVDLLNDLLSGALEQHAVDDVALQQQVETSTPQLIHHVEQPPDFWYDPASEYDPLATLDQIEQYLASAHNLTGLTTARNDFGFTGAGQTVAIIDSGIAWDHYALGGGLGPNFRVVGGKDFTEESDADPYDDGPYGSHGTHVAGIAGANPGSGANYGVAPGVDFVGLRVFNDQGNGYFSWVEHALRWVYTNRNSFENPITAVNLSLGTNWNADTVPSWTSLEDEFSQLESAGIFVAVSAGNAFASYNTPGLSYPAASPHVVPVMSVDDNGALSYFSQRHTRAIAAPGRSIVSTIPDYNGNKNGVVDDWGSKSGTSMAAPYVAGASVLIREAMEFVGRTNITQQAIYDHMRATAVSFFDSATNTTYKRLHLGNAIDALIPDDEYGSTIADAYNLGTIGTNRQISGLIGKLDDVDYFQFTATATGTMTFSVSTTHALVPKWHSSGVADQVSGTRGETFTIDVVAGQSYAIGISTNDGLGYYTLSASTDNDFTYIDWGTISQSRFNDQSVRGERWYRVQAGRSATLTVEALFASASGSVDISLYNSSLQLLNESTSTASGKRIDRAASVGEQFFIRCVGDNSNVDFRISNLLAANGDSVSLVGTAADDLLTFAAGATHQVTVNGVAYSFNSAAIKNFRIDGGGGFDTMHMTGTSGSEVAVLRTVISELYGADFSVYATGLRDSTIVGGGGSDIVTIFDSTKDDTFTAWHDHTEMVGPGFRTESRNFDRVFTYARGGHDVAILYDSAGDDTYSTWTNRAVMYGIGFSNDARDFERTFGFASVGIDRAYLRDGAGDDTYTTWEFRACMYGENFSNDARDFEFTTGFASDGKDRAFFRGSPGDDVYTTWPHMVVMAGPVTRHEGYHFESNQLFESFGNDRTYELGFDSFTSSLASSPNSTAAASITVSTSDVAERSSLASPNGILHISASRASANDFVLAQIAHATERAEFRKSGLEHRIAARFETHAARDAFANFTRLDNLLHDFDDQQSDALATFNLESQSIEIAKHRVGNADDATLRQAADEALQTIANWRSEPGARFAILRPREADHSAGT